MYETLSYIPEALLNQTYEAYIAEHIFKPLNMTSSTFSVVEAEAREILAHGFQHDAQDLTKGQERNTKSVCALFPTSRRRKDVGRSWWCLNLSTRPSAFFTFWLDSYFMVILGGLDFDVVEQRSSPVHE